MSRRRRRGVFGSVPWDTPADFPGVAVWLRPETGVTLVSDRVSVWADQSGNGNDYEQDTADDRPFIATADLNSLDVPDFQGAEHLLGPGLFDIWTDEVSEDYYIAIIAKIVTHSNFDGFFSFAKTNFDDVFQTGNSSAQTQYIWRGGSGVPATVNLGTAGVGNWFLLEVIKDGPSITIYRNGTSLFNNNSVRVLVASSTASDTGPAGTLGVRQTLDNFLVGRIGEFVVATQVPPAAHRNAYHNWAEDQYGLTIA